MKRPELPDKQLHEGMAKNYGWIPMIMNRIVEMKVISEPMKYRLIIPGIHDRELDSIPKTRDRERQ
jgi:hypothetical protein